MAGNRKGVIVQSPDTYKKGRQNSEYPPPLLPHYTIRSMGHIPNLCERFWFSIKICNLINIFFIKLWFPNRVQNLGTWNLDFKKCKIYHTVNYKCLKYDFSSPPPNSNDAFLKSLINDLIINFKLSLWALFYPLFEHIWRKLVLYKTFFSTIVISSEKKIF